MIKKIVSFLFLFVLSICQCKAYKMEILSGDFSFILDTKTSTAFVNKIYIGAYEPKKDLVIPEAIDFCKQIYVVNEIADYAFDWVIDKILSIKLPILKQSEMNGKVFKMLIDYNIKIV